MTDALRDALATARVAMFEAIYQLQEHPDGMGRYLALEALKPAYAATQSCEIGNCRHQACARQRVAARRAAARTATDG
jgi:hypothetical protein